MNRSASVYFYILFLLWALKLNAGPSTPCAGSNSAHDLAAIAEKNCEAQRDSVQCKELYQNIRDNKGDVSEKILVCSATTTEKIADSYIGCLAGGWDASFGVIITGAASLKNHLEENAGRLKACDANREQKVNIFRIYNLSQPTILRVSEPSQVRLAQSSCAKLEADLDMAKLNRDKFVADRVDYKEFIKNPNLTPDEAEYFAWKKARQMFAAKPSQSLMDLADKALAEYGVRISCYNEAAAAELRCEVLFQLATVGYSGVKTAVTVAAGIKSMRTVAAVKEVAAAADSTAAVTSSTAVNAGKAEGQSAAAAQAISGADHEAKFKDFLAKLKSRGKGSRDLEFSAKLTESERVQAAEVLVGRSLNPKELAALKKAHDLGPYDFDPNSPLSIEKDRILRKEGGFSLQESTLLRGKGIAGWFKPTLQKKMGLQTGDLIEVKFDTGAAALGKYLGEDDNYVYLELKDGSHVPTPKKHLDLDASKKLVQSNNQSSAGVRVNDQTYYPSKNKVWPEFKNGDSVQILSLSGNVRKGQFVMETDDYIIMKVDGEDQVLYKSKLKSIIRNSPQDGSVAARVAANKVVSSQKRPWLLSRKEWNDAGSPDLGINWQNKSQEWMNPKVARQVAPWENTAKAEESAINGFLKSFPDWRKTFREGMMRDENGKLELDRQVDFKNFKLQFRSNLSDVGLEDAREAILVGRKLGYSEKDILFYIVRNYVIGRFNPSAMFRGSGAEFRGMQIPPAAVDAYPALQGLEQF